MDNTVTVNKQLNFIGKNNATIDGMSKTKLFYIESYNVTFKNIAFINGNVTNNDSTISQFGGAVSGWGNYLPYFEECTFINNYADNGGAIAYCDAVNCTFFNNSGHYGGAMFSCGAVNCTFIANYADRMGGAMSGGRASNSYFRNNKVTSIYQYGEGGGAMHGGSAVNCTFIDNSASYGSAVCKGSVDNCSFINNSGYVIYDGHAISSTFLNGGSLNMGDAVNCTFDNSSEMFSATATKCIFVNSQKRAAKSCEIINCTFINNPGGAMSGGNAKGSLFINNSADYGGAISGTYAFDCIFIGNSAIDGGAMGGGKAENCTFINNSANGCGGVIFYGGFDRYFGYSYVSGLINCTFINNSANYGGVLSSHKPEYYSNGEKQISIGIINCTFIGNSALLNGGAIEISQKYRICNISNSLFRNNTVINGNGGAIYTITGGNITNSSFLNCSSNNGGAIWTEAILNIELSNFTDCISTESINYLGSTNSSLYNITDCIFDEAPGDISYHYHSTLTVNDLFIAKGEKGFLYANLSNICGAIANKKVNFEFNGRKFYSTTNSEGIAEFDVNNYINNLGETFIELSFTGDDINYPSSTNATVYINRYSGNLTVDVDGQFYNDTYLRVKLVNSITNVPISDVPVKLNFSNDIVIDLTTDFEGNARYLLPFVPDTYSVFAYVDEDFVDVNNVSVKNIVVKKLIGEIEVIPLNDNHTLMIRLFDPDDSQAVYRNVKINLDVGPDPVVKEELYTDENGYVLYDLLNFTKGTYSISVSVKGDYKDFYDYFLANYKISNLLNSKLNFSNNITFDFGDYGATNFTVSGGTVEYNNIKVVDHPEAIIGLSNNTISISQLSVGNYVLIVETTPDDYHNPVNATLNITVNNAKSKVSFSAGIVFEYGSSSSIHVIVEGGKVERKNIKIIGHPEANIVFKGNVITVSGLAVGNYNLQVTSTPDSDHTSSTGTVKVTVKKATAVIKASKITVAYKKGSQWNVKFVDSKNNKPISNMKVYLKVYTGKKYKTVALETNSKGEVSYQTKKLSKGKHKVIVTASDSRYNFNSYSSSIKVVKQTAVKFKVKTKTAKDGASLSITVLNKKTKKPINGVKIKLLIKDGKKTKEVTLKSMKKGKYKGVCGFGTNKLTVGKHKVKIISADVKYGGSAKTTLKITKRAKKAPAWETKDSGK